MNDLMDRIMDLWSAPPHDDQEAAAAFRMYYTDPVPINSVSTTARELVARARGIHRAFSDISYEIFTKSETSERIAIAFVLHAVHTGPLVSALGEIKPTGRPVNLRTLDILTVTGGRISEVWMAADEFGALANLGVLAVKS
jgi:predicted ester cyclase